MIWSGRIYSDNYQNLNASGFSWSATIVDYQNSYDLYMNTWGGMYPQHNDNSGKLRGFPVRCLAQLIIASRD